MATLTRQIVFINFSLLRKQYIKNTTGTKRCISTLGFIGLGNMGNHMAKNLSKKGFDVIVYDKNGEAARGMESEGMRVASSLAEVSSGVNYIVTMLPANQHVMEVYSSENGIIRNAKQGTILIDSSTVDPEIAQELEPMAKKRGLFFLDAPVSGGVMAAKNAELTFMVGGPTKSVSQAEKVLQAMGNKVFHCGEIGMGQVAKICNNMVLGITMAGLAEGMNLGIRSGMDPKLLTKIINHSSGRCWSSDVYNPVPGVFENVPSSNDYKGGFFSRLLTKDMALALSVAERSSSPVVLASLAHSMYQKICESGAADRDFSIVYQFLQDNKLKQK